MGITIVVVAIVLLMVFRTIKKDKNNKQNVVMDNKINVNEEKRSNNILSLFSWDGRLKRGTYFWIYACVGVCSNLLDLFLDTAGDELPVFLVWVFILYFFLAAWVVFVSTIKRCHDRGQSGWYALIPFYYIVLFFLKGEEKDNKYGLNPYVENLNEWM